MIRIGISYGVFSGLELLKPSIQNIRPFAAYIVVVHSPISSTGEPAPVYMKPLLQDLVETGLVDELVEFVPKITNNPQGMQDNCRMKREIGRLACKAAGCDFHLIRDCDEFHDQTQLKSIFSAPPNVDCTLSLIREYVQNPYLRLRRISGLYVPFLQKIDKKLHPRNRPFGVMCDGGRTVADVKTWILYPEKDLVLHHYTFVRYNEDELKRKYQGHGHCHRIGTQDKFIEWTQRFLPEELECVDDVFGIQNYWQGEFKDRWIKGL